MRCQTVLFTALSPPLFWGGFVAASAPPSSSPPSFDRPYLVYLLGSSILALKVWGNSESKWRWFWGDNSNVNFTIICFMPKAASKDLLSWKWPILEPLGLLFNATFPCTYTYIGFIPPMSPIRDKIHQGSVRFLHSDVLWVFVRRRFFRWCGDEKPIHEDLNVTWTVRQRGLIKKKR